MGISACELWADGAVICWGLRATVSLVLSDGQPEPKPAITVPATSAALPRQVSPSTAVTRRALSVKCCNLLWRQAAASIDASWSTDFASIVLLDGRLTGMFTTADGLNFGSNRLASTFLQFGLQRDRIHCKALSQSDLHWTTRNFPSSVQAGCGYRPHQGEQQENPARASQQRTVS